jgi:hypothetical protein
MRSSRPLKQLLRINQSTTVGPTRSPRVFARNGSFRNPSPRAEIWLTGRVGRPFYNQQRLKREDFAITRNERPNYGSHYDPFVTGLITWLTVGIVTFVFTDEWDNVAERYRKNA